MPSSPGQSRARAISAGMSKRPSAGKASTPLGAPPSRMRTVSARVSTPASPATPCARSHASSPCAARQLAGSVTSCFTTRPRAAIVVASMSSAIGADVADMGEGEGDDLPGIGRVGQRLLIAGHAGVEAHLGRLARGVGAEAAAPEHRAVAEHEAGGGAGGRRGRVRHGRSVLLRRRAGDVGQRKTGRLDQRRPVARRDGAVLAPFAQRLGAHAQRRAAASAPPSRSMIASTDIVMAADYGKNFPSATVAERLGNLFPGDAPRGCIE